MQLKADQDGFLVGGSPIHATGEERILLRQVRDDVRAIRKLLESGKKSSAEHARAKDRAANDDDGERTTTAAKGTQGAHPIATPVIRLVTKSGSAAVGGTGAAKDVTGAPSVARVRGESDTPSRPSKTVATPKLGAVKIAPVALSVTVKEPKAPKRPTAAAKPIRQSDGVASQTGRDSAGRFVAGANKASKDGEGDGGNKVLNLLGDIKDGITNVVDLSGGDEVDPAIKAAHELQGIATTAINGVKTVGSAVGKVALPVVSGIAGRFKKPESVDASPAPWYRRIYSELRGLRREESAFNKAQLRTLNHIDGKEDAKQGGGIMGVLGMIGSLLMAALGPLFALLTRIPVLGPLLTALSGFLPKMFGAKTLPTTVPPSGQSPAGGASAVEAGKKPSLWQRAKTKVSGWMGNATTTAPDGAPTGGPLSGAATAAGEAVKKPSLISRAATGAKGLMKRIPLLGSALAAIGAGAEVYSSETDDTLTRGQKDKKTGSAIGGGVGSIGGMMAGASAGAALGALGGPIGMAIGGLVGGAAGAFFGENAGKVIGETVGGWVSELRAADIPGKVVGAWTATTAFISSTWADTTTALGKAWDAGVGVFTEIWAGVTRTFDGVFTGLSEVLKNFGIDLPAVVAKASEAVSAAKEAAANMASEAAKAVKNKAAEVAEAAKNSAVAKGAAYASEKVSNGWNDAKKYLVGASNKVGIDSGIVAKVAALESGFDSEATPTGKDGKKMSSAHGYGQFIDSTWTDVLNRHGAKYGVEGAGKLTKEQAEKFRGDKTLQASMLAEFTKENIEKGRKYGGKDDDANAYAFHNLGDGDAKKLLGGMGSGLSVRESLLKGATSEAERARVEKVISNNKSVYGDGSIAAADAYANMGKLMRRGDSFAQDARGGAPSTPTPTAPTTASSPPPAAIPQVAVATPAANAAPPALANVQTYASLPDRIPEATPKTESQSGLTTPISLDRPAPPSVVVVGGKQLAGRDLNNRQMAHVATGGLSGSVT